MVAREKEEKKGRARKMNKENKGNERVCPKVSLHAKQGNRPV
jgi:hypothetical protein